MGAGAAASHRKIRLPNLLTDQWPLQKLLAQHALRIQQILGIGLPARLKPEHERTIRMPQRLVSLPQAEWRATTGGLAGMAGVILDGAAVCSSTASWSV